MFLSSGRSIIPNRQPAWVPRVEFIRTRADDFFHHSGCESRILPAGFGCRNWRLEPIELLHTAAGAGGNPAGHRRGVMVRHTPNSLTAYENIGGLHQRRLKTALISGS